jgi:hypothetical protein
VREKKYPRYLSSTTSKSYKKGSRNLRNRVFRWGTRMVPRLYRSLCVCDVCCVCVTKKEGYQGWVFYSPNLYSGQAIANSRIQTAEHVYTECTKLFGSAQAGYPTYFARLQFLNFLTCAANTLGNKPKRSTTSHT